MSVKRFTPVVSTQSGFTLVELLMVVGILGVLASIGMMALSVNRQKSFDSQVISIMRSLLTVAAIDEPKPDPAVTGEPTDDPVNPVTISGIGGNLADFGDEFAMINIPNKISWTIVNDGNSNTDKWQFFFGHPGGNNGYYFWIPGSSCIVDADTSGNPSDRIFWDPDKSAGSYWDLAGL